MGLDLALGGLVLLSAIRGWMKGFLVQAIRLGGLVAAAYAAVPAREQSKPYVVPYLPTIRADLLDRLLWWGSAVVCYFLIVGVTSLVVAVARRPRFGLEEPNRGDQFAGFGLGIAKGLVAASFLVAGIHRYAEPLFARSQWAGEQSKGSYAWEWHEKYRPAAKIWTAPPVQRFVAHVQKMGLMAPGEAPAAESEGPKSVQTASRGTKMEIPSGGTPEDLDSETSRVLDDIQRHLESLQVPPPRP